MSVKGFKSHVLDKITMLQCTCSLAAVFPSILIDNFLVSHNEDALISNIVLCCLASILVMSVKHSMSEMNTTCIMQCLKNCS
jgi:hypothetical protein